MTLEEAIVDRVRRMPPSQQEAVLRFADRLQQSPVRVVPYNDRRLEFKWLAENRAAYPNLWVALDGDQLIAADPDGLKVYQAAKAKGIESALIVHIVPQELPFGGW